MKLNFGKRLVLFVHWLLSLIVFALVVLWCVAPQIATDIPEMINHAIGTEMAEIAGIVAAVVYVLLTVFSVAFIFSRDKKKGERGFITVDSSEAGRTRIAIGAVEQMIRQAVRCVDGIADMKASIINNEDTISINTSVAIVSGAHVPTVTMNIQRAIRSYIELNCGVGVREVSVSVHSLENTEEGGKHGRRKGSVGNVPVSPVYQPAEEPKQVTVVEEESVAPVQEADVQEVAAAETEEIPATETEAN